MQAGLLTETINIYNPSITTNEYGETIQNYTKVYTTRAKVDYSGGRKNIENNEVFFDYTKTFHIRYYVTINENMLIEWQNKKYRILSIEELRKWNEKVITGELINE